MDSKLVEEIVKVINNPDIPMSAPIKEDAYQRAPHYLSVLWDEYQRCLESLRWIPVEEGLPECSPRAYETYISKPVLVIHKDRIDYPIVAHAIFTDSIYHALPGVAIPTNGASSYKFIMWHSAIIQDLGNPHQRRDIPDRLPKAFGAGITHWLPIPQ